MSTEPSAPAIPSPPLGAERVRVRWGTLPTHAAQSVALRRCSHHLVVPEPDDPVAMPSKLSGTCGIGDVVGSMLAAIDLDRQFPCRAGEVHHALADRMLAAELPRPAFGPQGVPETLLRIGGVAAQTACRGGRSSQRHWPPPLPGPLRPEGRRGSLRRRLFECVNPIPSPPLGAERVRVRWGTLPTHASRPAALRRCSPSPRCSRTG